MSGRYKVLITTSGIGSRLKHLTQKTNKALLKIAGKPAIEYILDRYPKNTEFVVTLGYLGSQVKNTLLRCYSNRKFTFVKVDLYQDAGSSLGYSILSVKNHLQSPFIFHACDTIILDNIPLGVNYNWIIGYDFGDGAEQYRTLNVNDGKVVWINDKGVKNFDYIHIGLIGIMDYNSFWRNLERLYKINPKDEALNDTFVINEMIKEGIIFSFKSCTNWFDTGNPIALKRTISELKNYEKI